jgi:hypothetical protein
MIKSSILQNSTVTNDILLKTMNFTDVPAMSVVATNVPGFLYSCVPHEWVTVNLNCL